ncbi:hypothetical protein LY76DRAFT_625847 [Colletotrichum caudatum]|nr:hypothetical protein LY76DRAFT_625847 [Colletotrichum caudatum]
MVPGMGSPRALASGESQFVGSSSAFSTADGKAANTSCHLKRSSAHRDPSPEDCVVGEENSSSRTAFGRTPGQENDQKPPNCPAGPHGFNRPAIHCRCIFNIARLIAVDGSPDVGSATIRPTSELLPSLSHLAPWCDTASVQPLLFAQSIFQSGMYRCPTRYEHFTSDERPIRKRPFWSSYVLDRFVSQSLGRPSGIRDSDIDVCPPGHKDLHGPVLGDVPSRSATILDQHREAECILEHHVHHSQLVGRILEVFHESIHARQLDNQIVLFLKVDVFAFGNDLTQSRLGSIIPGIPSLAPGTIVFPFVSCYCAALLLDRPLISLNPRCGKFKGALQTCIGAANAVVYTFIEGMTQYRKQPRYHLFRG